MDLDVSREWPIWQAPFTDAQIAALNEYQRAGRFHPYTCGTDSSHSKLVPSRRGWHCVACDYTQDWALATPAQEEMANG